eukprot:5057929-Pleurochrysis_carterae.AAC.1
MAERRPSRARLSRRSPEGCRLIRDACETRRSRTRLSEDFALQQRQDNVAREATAPTEKFGANLEAGPCRPHEQCKFE